MTAVQTPLPTIDIVRFLLARIDEEDQALRTTARRARRAPGEVDNTSFDHSRKDLVARRQVLGGLQHLLVLRDLPNEKPVRDVATHILLSLTVPYDTHVQYRSEWQPQAR